MIVVRGRQASELSRPDLETLIAAYEAVTLDVGTGDGAFAFRYAAARPPRFVIAIDPVRENMRERSAKAARKPERGGLPNVLYVVASVEHIPPELTTVADEIFVTLPWGSLMRGIILGEDIVLAGIASIARRDASLRIVLNTRIFDDPVPIDAQDLPEVTPRYVREHLAAPFARHNIELLDTRVLDPEEVLALDTTWAKRLSHRHPPPSVLINARVTPHARS